MELRKWPVIFDNLVKQVSCIKKSVPLVFGSGPRGGFRPGRWYRFGDEGPRALKKKGNIVLPPQIHGAVKHLFTW